MKRVPYNPDQEQSKLDGLDKKNPFLVPDQYFEKLPEKIMSSIISLPDFEGAAKSNPFLVPENYFEKLPSEIQDRIHQEKISRPVWNEWLSIFLRPQFSLVFASLIIMLILSIRFTQHKNFIQSPTEEFSMSELENSGYVTDVDEGLLVDVFIQLHNNTAQVKEVDLYKQYLLDNDIDLKLIESKL